jgi:carbonic anhydrase
MTKVSRRHFVSCACCASVADLTGMRLSLPPGWAAAGKHTDLSADQALAVLKEGNRSFTTDAPFRRESTDRNRRIEIAREQTPFCVLVGCSDSRVSPELLFGRGLGELFIEHNAGNTVDTTAMGSIQYAVVELEVPLIVVLGHEKCGCLPSALLRQIEALHERRMAGSS